MNISINHIFLNKKGRPRCYAVSPTVQDMFRLPRTHISIMHNFSVIAYYIGYQGKIHVPNSLSFLILHEKPDKYRPAHSIIDL